MSYAVVKNSAGVAKIVSNTVKNSAGGDVAVLNDVLDSDTDPHTIFGASVEVNPNQVVNFRLSDSVNRIFRL